MKKIVVYLTATFLFISCSSKEEGEDELDDIISGDESGLSIGNQFYVFDKAIYYDESIKFYDEEDISGCTNSNELRKIWETGGFQFLEDSIEYGEDGDSRSGNGFGLYFYLTSNSPNGANGIYKGPLSLINDLLNTDFKSWPEYYEYEENSEDNGEQLDCLNLDGYVLELSIEKYINGEYVYDYYNQISLAEGEFELKRNNDNTITIKIRNGIDDSNNQITFYYNGIIEEFDYSSKSNSLTENSFYRN